MIKPEPGKHRITTDEPCFKDTDLIIFNRGFCQPAFDYYSRRPELLKTRFPKNYSEVNEEDIRELEKIIRDTNRVGFILAYSKDDKRLIKKFMNKQYASINHREYVSFAYATGKRDRIDVFLFQKR